MIVNLILGLVILALFVFTTWLLWPDMERDFDADMRRRIAELDAEERIRRSL